jgi:hypothetical protein
MFNAKSNGHGQMFNAKSNGHVFNAMNVNSNINSNMKIHFR